MVVGAVPGGPGRHPVAAQDRREDRGRGAARRQVRGGLLVEAAGEAAVDRVVVVQAGGEDPALFAGLRLLADPGREVGHEVALELGLGDPDVRAALGEAVEALAGGRGHVPVDPDHPDEVAVGLGVERGERQVLHHELAVGEPLLVEHADPVAGGDDVQELLGPRGGAAQAALESGRDEGRQSHGLTSSGRERDYAVRTPRGRGRLLAQG
nr:hypothetical protein GCM10025732_03690 [Glycomyces mayteni]